VNNKEVKVVTQQAKESYGELEVTVVSLNLCIE
jgi:hypothetical protein